ncbi:Cytochrome c551/c552-like protein [Flavobacterium anhuiense]|uniref:Cytochrome c551/c552-like protein n=1 Tax=Flavobacterium anhuiense TaxID=459526 RepID=A0A444VWQ0_9FLAO|nr:c-type cytochrome [Flavobacterium anhuiense]RYJ37984.1 Cytochrome c551/c552-like protein [Flavobacterium anhuiense]
MKKILFLSAVLAFTSCKKETSEPTNATTESVSEGESAKAKSPEELGKQLFEGAGNCFACHQPDQKIVGPSIKEIAKIYKDQKGDIVTFLKGNAEPIVDPSQFEVMKTNFAITKAMSDEELKAIEAYIYSNLK